MSRIRTIINRLKKMTVRDGICPSCKSFEILVNNICHNCWKKNKCLIWGQDKMLLKGNVLLCRHCGYEVFWKGGIIDFNVLGFDHKNLEIICVQCGRKSFYDIKELSELLYSDYRQKAEICPEV